MHRWPRQPIGIGETCFVMDRSGGVIAFSRDGQRIWSIKLDSAVIGEPVVLDQSVWFLTRGGKLHVRGLSSGEKRESLDVNALPSGGLLDGGQTGDRPGRKGDHPARGRLTGWRESPMNKPRGADTMMNQPRRLMLATGASAVLFCIGAWVLDAAQPGSRWPRAWLERFASSPALRSHHADRRHGPDRRTRQSPPFAGHRPDEGRQARRARPWPGDPARGKHLRGPQGQDRDAGQRQAGWPRRRGQPTRSGFISCKGRPTRFAISRSSVQISRKSNILRICCWRSATGGWQCTITRGPLSIACGCRTGIQVGPGSTTMSIKCTVCRGKQRLDRWRRRARPQAASRATGSQA